MPTAKSLVEFYPVGDNILVEVIEEDKETDSGIALPASAAEKETVTFGTVVVIPKLVEKFNYFLGENKEDFRNFKSDEIETIPKDFLKIAFMDIEVGDTVVCKKFDYYKVRIGSGDKDYRLYTSNSIIAVIKK